MHICGAEIIDVELGRIGSRSFGAPGIYPNLKDAEKLVAHSIFMENPSDEQFSKLKEDFRKISLGQ